MATLVSSPVAVIDAPDPLGDSDPDQTSPMLIINRDGPKINGNEEEAGDRSSIPTSEQQSARQQHEEDPQINDATLMRTSKSSSSSSSINNEMIANKKDFSPITELFQAGDHVYVWCHAGVYQHHGIVLQVNHVDGTAIIADFTNLGVEANGSQKDETQKKKTTTRLDSLHSGSDSSDSEGASHSCSGLPGGFRMVQEDLDQGSSSSKNEKKTKWCKVKYNANRLEQAFWRPGTCSGSTPDAADQILARVHFLMMHFHLVPPYHLFECNCETVAVWCTTGDWRTKQVSHLLNWTKTTSVLGTGGAYLSAATTTTTTCATTGVAGVLGVTTELSLLAANPLLLPVICITGVAVGGMALWNSLQTRHKWKVTSTLLNMEFQRFWTEPASGVRLVCIDNDDDETMTVDTAATTTTSVDDMEVDVSADVSA